MGLNPSGATTIAEVKAEKVLDVFIAYLGLDGSSSYTTNGITASKSFADGMLHAVAKNISMSMDESDYFRMAIYLSTQSPIRE